MDRELIELKGALKIQEARVQALIKILSKEGVLTQAEVDDEVTELLANR
ncbi:hypothetical protein J4464_05770 [Candidatus Woesearchaeota archaeon]|nr:hypothetical protein [Candidatus Woesearchaeota archaeon]